MPSLSLSKMGITRPVLTVSAVLALQVALLYGLNLQEEEVLETPALANIPARISEWQQTGDLDLEGAVVSYLRPDAFINRAYTTRASTPLNFFVAYFKSQRSGYGPHSPRQCLPGAGWLPVSMNVVSMALPGQRGSVQVNRHLLEKGTERVLMLYWYQREDKVWASETESKLMLLANVFVHRRSDVLLVRIIMPISSAPAEMVEKEAITFASSAFESILATLVPRV